MTDIIRNLIQVDIDINLSYRESKLPVWIRKKIAKRKRKKLYVPVNIVEKATNNIPVGLLHEYCKVIYDTYPPYGNYRKCSSIINYTGPSLTASFTIPIDENKSATMTIYFRENIGEVDIRHVYVSDGKTIFSYSEKLDYNESIVTDIEDIDYSDLEKISFKNEKRIVKYMCIKAIHDDIVYFLKEIVERSERIYQI